MYFGRDGIVSACCYSRMNQIGRYPEQTVDEIWSGARANAMRVAMRDQELPGGCDLCADQLYARNFAGFLARQYDGNAQASGFGEVGEQRYPTRIDFELSNKCNLECAMCSGFFSSSIRANRENLPPLPQQYDRAFVDQIAPYLEHLSDAKFLGGEPFLIDVYYDIWELLIDRNPNCRVSITTNGTVFTEKVKRILEKLNCEIILSLDSVVKPTYEAIRKNATYERTMENFDAICAINQRKGVNLSITVCPMGMNALEMPGLVEFANERGVRVHFNTVVFPEAHSIKALPLERQREILELYRSSLIEGKDDIERDNWAALKGFSRQIEFWMGAQDAVANDAADLNPFAKRCAEMLASGSGAGSLPLLLRDLVHGPSDLVQFGSGDAVADLVAYYEALWDLGESLAGEGLLQGTRYDRREEEEFLQRLRRDVSASQARKIYREARRFPKILLQYVGTLTAQQLIELQDEHLAEVPVGAV
jgi:molybdenum cofactor biosynthesis enzyme MoaA